jgi:outer membrane protein assembly factor BamB
VYVDVVSINATNQVGSNVVMGFDAQGVTNCSGSPRSCSPVWSAAVHAGSASYVSSYASPAIANGALYIADDNGRVYAFDTTGKSNCSAAPPQCSPLWTTAGVGDAIRSGPTIANGVLYVASVQTAKFYAYDATGKGNCSGSPPLCSPLWSASVGTLNQGVDQSSPAVANGVVYVGSRDGSIYAFDAQGGTHCSGTPVVCTPLWTANTGGTIDGSSPAVANGFVYIGSQSGHIYAYGSQTVSTSVALPSPGTKLSGTATLAASASSTSSSIGRVDYHLGGGNYHDASIGTATPYRCCGWVYNWDTTTVPNGIYVVYAIAYDAEGNVGRSTDVKIVVSN